MAKYKFYGTAKWAKTKKPDPKYDVYSIDLYMDKNSLSLYNKSGIQGKLKEDEDGIHKSFRRPITMTRKGETVDAGPPVVTDVDGNKLDAYIGNGSKVAIVVDVYQTKKGIGHRLEEVQVLELVEYNEVVDAHADGMDEVEDEPSEDAKPSKRKASTDIPF